MTPSLRSPQSLFAEAWQSARKRVRATVPVSVVWWLVEERSFLRGSWKAWIPTFSLSTLRKDAINLLGCQRVAKCRFPSHSQCKCLSCGIVNPDFLQHCCTAVHFVSPFSLS